MVRIMLAQRVGEKCWTQSDLARKTGIRPTTINVYYHELTERIRFDHLERICAALECDVADILTCEYKRIAQAEKMARRSMGKRNGAA